MDREKNTDGTSAAPETTDGEMPGRTFSGDAARTGGNAAGEEFEELFARLARSEFRSRFRLGPAEAAYAERKGAETTLPEDTDDRKRLMLELEGTRVVVWNRLQRHEFRGKTVVLKLKYADFRQITRSKTLPAAVESADTLRRVAEELLAAVDLRGRRVRLIGLTVGNSPEACADCVQLRFDFGE